MAVSQSPSTEAMAAIVARINSATAYEFDVVATYSEQIINPTEEVTELRVDVVSESEEQLNETLDIEDRTSHIISIWVRKKVTALDNDSIDPLKLLVRQIFQRVNNYDTADGRVRVWEVDASSKQCPDKSILRQLRLFTANIMLRIEVEAS
tara:strand:+ start:774 stop:1226 length:453 start_codon:yes stop_codon:yes gene_type:complete